MDLKNLKPKSETVEVILVHPNTLEPLMNDGSDTEMSITVYAPHSAEYKKVIHEQTDRRLQKIQKSKKVQLSSSELEEGAIDLLARVTKEWDISYDGVSPKLTVDKAKEIYSEFFWIRSQIEEAIEETLDFTMA